MKANINLMSDVGYYEQVARARDLCDAELSSKERILKREQWLSQAESFLRDSMATDTTPIGMLEAWKAQGLALGKGFSEFRQNELSNNHERLKTKLDARVADIVSRLEQKTDEMNAIWDELYEVDSIDGVRKLNIRIKNILSSGIADQDRQDFEEIYDFLNRFLDDIDDLKRISYNRKRIEETYAALSDRYSRPENELDLSPILVKIYDKTLSQLDVQTSEWISQHLSIDLQTADEYTIVGWKRDVAMLPTYLDDETITKVEQIQKVIDSTLSLRKVKHIIMLFSELGEEEKAMVRRELL